MNRFTFTVVVSALLASLLLSCSSNSKIGADAAIADANGASTDAAPNLVINESKVIASLGFIEGTFVASPTDTIVVTVAAPATFDWNIHGHSSGTTSVIDGKRDVNSIAKTFIPTTTGEWFFLMSNKGEVDLNAQVKIEIYGSATFGWD
jgi:hypothetical protein